MIFGNINQWDSYKILQPSICSCFDYCKNNDLLSFEKGSYEIKGKEIFVNIVEYETKASDEKIWEAHRDYIDIHVTLDGKELIEVNFIENMQQKTFDEQNDFLPLFGEAKSFIISEPGDFLICYPKDGHKPGVWIETSSKIKKAIFKVAMH